MRDNKVQSVTRAVQLINLIADHPSGITVGRLAQESGLHKSTVSRLVMTLEAAGTVNRNGDQSTLQISPSFAKQFAQPSRPTNLRTIARPYLNSLSAQFGEAAALALPEEDQAVFIEQVSPNLAVQVKDWTGSRFPLHSVSPGKLFLAYRSPAEQDHYLSRPLAAYTSNTTTDPAQLRQTFKEIKETGISWIFDEFADGLSGVAGPIFNHTQNVIGALVVYAPSYRFPDPERIDEINLIIRDFAARCSAEVQSQSNDF